MDQMENGMILDRSQTPSTSGGARTRSASHYSEPDEHGFQRQALEVPPSEIKQQSGCFGCQGRKNKNSPSRVNTKIFIFFFSNSPLPQPLFHTQSSHKRTKAKTIFQFNSDYYKLSVDTISNKAFDPDQELPPEPTKTPLMSSLKKKKVSLVTLNPFEIDEPGDAETSFTKEAVYENL